MAYCIVEVIYGVAGTVELDEAISKLPDPMNGDHIQQDPDMVETVYGFRQFYTGSGIHTPRYCGVPLDRFDEATDIAIRPPRTEPTEEEIQRAREKIEALDPELRELATDEGVWFVFYTS